MTARFYQLWAPRLLAARGPLLAALLSFVAWQPFVRPDFDVWRADDGEYHLLRVYVFERAFLDGQLLPRWTPDLFVGFGYPIFNFYAPGTYYAALILRALGLDVYSTVQALGALAACVGAAGAYCLADALTSSRSRGARAMAGLTAALAYAYAPYPFITNLLIRADLAEALGLALLPWVALTAWAAGRSPGVRTAVGAALAVAAVILTHNLTALVALPVALAFGIAGAICGPAPQRVRALAHTGAALALALGATTFFWLPALLEQRHVQIEVALASGHKAPVTWLIDPLGATAQTGDPRNPQTAAGPLDLHPAYPYDLNYPPKPSLAQGALALAALGLLGIGA
ncbi:MAG TPA: 6-pyruvoyl-tetrahydropterin synthase-related protein, partial [Chloroflexota bacterium]|nr:6-pyruvoyl-tetrahydropterin synthase-related protein [Chloroflexota bacterium]